MDKEFIYEAEQLAYDRLNRALILIQQAHDDLTTAKNATGDSGLSHRIEDYMGALSLIRDSGNIQLNRLLGILDPG